MKTPRGKPYSRCTVQTSVFNWWLSYDVIINMTFFIYDKFAPNFDVANQTIQQVPVPNLKLFGPMKTELWTKEVEEFSNMLYGKMGWWAFFRPPTCLPQ